MTPRFPNVIKFKPPLVFDEGEVETVLGVLADSLKVVFPSGGRSAPPAAPRKNAASSRATVVGASIRMAWRSPGRISSRDPGIRAWRSQAMRGFEPMSPSPVTTSVGTRIRDASSARSVVARTR